MSLVDPEQRWWRNVRVLRVTATVLWIVVFLVAALTAWSNALVLSRGEWTHGAGADWLVGTGDLPASVVRIAEISIIAVMWPVIAASAVEGYARHRAGGGEAWFVASAFAWALLGLGTGCAIAALSAPVSIGWAVLFLTLSILAFTLRPLSRKLIARHEKHQSWARMHGTPVMAVATNVSVVTTNSNDHWRVTLRYDDTAGRTRWHKGLFADEWVGG